MDAGMGRPTIATIASGHGDTDQRWLRRIERLIPGRRGPVAGDFRLTQRNIYILPSRAGAAFIGVILLMLLASVNFGLSLGYALTFLLGSLGLVGMMHTFRNLSGKYARGMDPLQRERRREVVEEREHLCRARDQSPDHPDAGGGR